MDRKGPSLRSLFGQLARLRGLPALADLRASPGFSFEEWLSGSYWRLDAPTEEGAVTLHLRASADDLANFARTRTWQIEGTVDVEGITSGADIEGAVALKLVDERRVLYRVGFRGDDGRSYELSGQKEWSGLAPVDSMTLLAASLYDDQGEEFARATLRFDVRADALRWVKSFRVHAPWHGAHGSKRRG
jgi:hypothetical protein